ncbi:MAG: hypothetical protein IIY82_01270, partial [Firmicutes bacterium]|nr:hypothetical protein [Bacillota bacterium]
MKRKYGIWLAIAVFLAMMALPLLTGAEDTYADSNVIEVSTLAELRSAVQKEGAYIVLKNDITSADKYTVEIRKDNVTLDLGGHRIRSTYPCQNGNDTSFLVLVADCENVKVCNGLLIGEGEYCRVFNLNCGNIEIADLSTWGGSFLSCWIQSEATCRVTRCGFATVSDAVDSGYAGVYSGHMGRIVLDDVDINVQNQYGIGLYGDDPELELVDTKIYGSRETTLFTRITEKNGYYSSLLAPHGELYVDGVRKTGLIPQTTINGSKGSRFRGQTLETKAGLLTLINSVSLSITPPAAGARPDYKPTFGADTYYNDLYHEDGFRSSILWYDKTDSREVDPQEGKFLAGHEYSVTIFLSAEPGCWFSDGATAKVNGESATAVYKSAYHQLEVMYTFPAAQNPKDLGMLTVNVKNGAATLIGLPGYYLYQQFLGSLYQLDIIGGFTMFGDSYHPIAIDLDNDGSFDVWTEEQGISGGHEINNYKITFYKLPTCSVKSSKTLYLPKFLEDNMQDMDDVTGNPLHYYSKVKFLFDDTVKAKFVVENTCVSTPYTGTARKPDSISVTLVAGNYKLDWWNPLYHVSYRNNVNVGTAQIIVGIAPSDTVVKKTFQITPVNLAAAATKTSVSGIKASYAYTGKAIKPTPTVKALVGGATKTLKAGTDYTVKYTNNINPGTATVTITGKGNF